MANEEKFAKNLDDAELDEVAGGTTKERQKDIAFLNAVGVGIGINLSQNASDEAIQRAWSKVGIFSTMETKKANHYEDDALGTADNMSRQDAMIYAMRRTKKVVDLDDYN